MKNLGLLTIVGFVLLGAACQKQGTSVTNVNTVNSNQKNEQVSSAPKGLKPSEPCGWFEESLKLKANEYKQSPSMPDLSYCVQVKPLANNGSFEYHAIGNAEMINKFLVYVRVNERHSAKQKEASYTMLSLAAMEIADRAAGQKIADEILKAILSGEPADFILPPGDDKSKPQIKTVYVENEKENRRMVCKDGYVEILIESSPPSARIDERVGILSHANIHREAVIVAKRKADVNESEKDDQDARYGMNRFHKLIGSAL